MCPDPLSPSRGNQPCERKRRPSPCKCVRYNALPKDEREKLVPVFANLLQHDPNKIARQPDSIAAGIQPPVVSTPAPGRVRDTENTTLSWLASQEAEVRSVAKSAL